LQEASEATVDTMATAFERRFRTQSIDLFDPAGGLSAEPIPGSPMRAPTLGR